MSTVQDIKRIIIQLAEAYIMNLDRRREGALPMFTLNGAVEPEAWERNYLNAMVFFVKVGAENYGYAKDGNTKHDEWARTYREELVVIITERHNVFVGKLKERTELVRFVDQSSLENQLAQYEWINSSNHDSCWREDGLRHINEEYYRAYEHCFGFMPNEHRPAPIASHSYVELGEGLFGAPFQFARIELERHPTMNDRTDSYFKQPKSIKFYRHQINLILN